MSALWTPDELIVAMNVYSRLKFGQLDARNRLIVAVARRLGRTPGSLAMKLCNLASLDPHVRSRGRVGLSGASRLDRQIWNKFQSDWTHLATESEARFNELMAGDASVSPTSGSPIEANLDERDGPTETEANVRRRLGQQFFRRVVLVSYGEQCCVTGIPIPELLSASHIVAWADNPKDRLNPRNGLCLAKTQDAAFDRHLITLDEDLRLVVSRSIRDHFAAEAIRTNFQRYEGKRVRLPDRFAPDPALLARHREKVEA